MAKLVRVQKPGGGYALARKGTKLVTDAGGAPCCCGGQGWCAQGSGDCWPVQLMGERFTVSLQVPNLSMTGTVFATSTQQQLEFHELIAEQEGEATITLQTVRTGSTGYLRFESVDSDTPLQVRARRRQLAATLFDIPDARVHLATSILYRLGFNPSEFENVWPIPSGIRSIDIPLDFLGQGIVSRLKSDFQIRRSKEIGLGLPTFEVYAQGSTTNTPCDGNTNYQANWTAHVGSFSDSVNGWVRPSPGGSGFPGSTHSITTTGDGLSCVMTHRAITGNVLSGTTRYNADSICTARWIISPIVPCSFGRDGQLPPGIDPETMQPYTQPGRCAGCGQ